MNIKQVQTFVYSYNWTNVCSNNQKEIDQTKLLFESDHRIFTANWLDRMNIESYTNLNIKLSNKFNPLHSRDSLSDLLEDIPSLFKKLEDFSITNEYDFDKTDITNVTFLEPACSKTFGLYIFKKPIEIVGLI
ncbi:hypothetical protein [Companilactobacillus sp. HBUAS56257]|jgi:hypothetical protein|uniref:hypothetical protein n=1 Tax=Companilactobacillus sp. HBUAS56257 TaxID=3109360 RepID=UPI002FF2764A